MTFDHVILAFDILFRLYLRNFKLQKVETWLLFVESVGQNTNTSAKYWVFMQSISNRISYKRNIAHPTQLVKADCAHLQVDLPISLHTTVAKYLKSYILITWIFPQWMCQNPGHDMWHDCHFMTLDCWRGCKIYFLCCSILLISGLLDNNIFTKLLPNLYSDADESCCRSPFHSQRPWSGDYKTPSVHVCVSVHSSHFCINLNISFIYEDIFSKFAGNV